MTSTEDLGGLPSDLPRPGYRALVGLDRWACPGACVTIGVVSGNAPDKGDREALAVLAGPIAAAGARI